MRLAIFSDIHGNLPALEAILGDIKTVEDVDEAISLGDVVSIGPKPVECLNLIQKENITAIIGNHEVECITRKHRMRKYDYDPFFDWQCSILSDKNFQYIQKLSKFIVRNGVRFQHFVIDGTIDEQYPDFCYVHDINEDSKSFIDLIQEYPEKNIFIGHEHHAVTKIYGDKNVFCIGSSGCTHGDSTFYKLIDVSDDGRILSIKNRCIKYDRKKLVKDFAEKDYPSKDFFAKEFFHIEI